MWLCLVGGHSGLLYSRAECFCYVTAGLGQTLMRAAEGVILLMVDRHFPLKSERQMMLLTFCFTTLSILLFPGRENTSLGLEGVEKRRGEEDSVLSPDKKKMKRVWEGSVG